MPTTDTAAVNGTATIARTELPDQAAMTRSYLAARLAQRRDDLSILIEQANRQIAAQQGAIAELEMLLAELDAAGEPRAVEE